MQTEAKKQWEWEEVKVIIQQERKLLPRVGTRKLYHLVQSQFNHQGLQIGRDKLFEILRHYDLHIKPQRRYVQTTMSKHWMRKHPNLLQHAVITAPEQAVVSDITYIKTEEGNCYLNMLTDVYSRKIMGYALAENMETGSMIKALEMATKQIKSKQKPMIHHSDRGLQYCSHEYIEMQHNHNIIPSMTEHSDPYENALAERMNRTMKEEFGLGNVLQNRAQAKQLVEEAVHLYNHLRPHLSLKMKTPNQVHHESLQL